MKRLLVCSEPDIPSVNMRRCLLDMGGWEQCDPVSGYPCMMRGDDAMVSIPDIHIRHEGLDAELRAGGLGFDEIVVMSKHSAKSGTPSLTAHPIGNYHENDFGGRAESLVKAAPASMTDALRRILAYNDMEGTQTCFEVTHHGPWLETPTFFIEIGSDESNWGNMHAAEVLARVITDLDPDYDAPRLVGVGGGHYAPRFTEVAAKFRASFGHMLPYYQMEGRDDEDIARMVKSAVAATDADAVYIHRKSMKKPEERRVAAIIESAGFEIVSSSDLEPLGGNPRRCRRKARPGSPS